jgi:hypothetical protein
VKRLLVAVAACAVILVLPAAASAGYTITRSGSNYIVGPGDQTSIGIRYSAVCFLFCTPPTDEQIGSLNESTTFTTVPGVCSQVTGGNNTRFNCDSPHVTTQINATNSADSVEGFCLGEQTALTFNGLGGNDSVDVFVCTGNVINMGDGDDTAEASGTISGGAGADNLGGDPDVASNDTISGDAGKDFIRGRGGNDTLDGGADRDTIDGNEGNDTLRGGSGRDLLNPGLGKDVIEGGADTDEVSYEDRTTPVSVSLDNLANDGQAGEQDRVATDVESIIGSPAGDTLTGDGNPNDIEGGDSGDVIDPRGGPDFVDAGAGNDRIVARDGAIDRVICGTDNDQAIVDAFDTVIGCEDVQASRELMPDIDADGVLSPADCNDRDARRRPGNVDRPGNGIDEDCSGSDAPFFRILSPIQSTFTAARTLTHVNRLNVLAVPEGGRVELRCRGGKKLGCFSGVKRFRAPRRGGDRSVLKPLRGRRLRPKAVVEVRVLDADSIGKVVRFTTRRGFKLPKSRSMCLVPGRKSPGRCPRS